MKHRFAVASQRVVTPDRTGPAAIIVSDGIIEQVTSIADASKTIPVVDYGESIIGPGLVDSHIHINEPGRTEWEGFATASKAAAAGGITTLIDMPLNSNPVTTDPDSLAQKIAAAQGQCWVDVGFYGGLVPGNAGEIPSLIEAGVFGIKAFLCDSGLAEFPAATIVELKEAMPILADLNVPLLVHAELTDALAPSMSQPTSFAQFVDSRPSRWEGNAIRMLLELARVHRCHVHIVHLATAEESILNALAVARHEGVPITVETCPHYLYFAMEEIADGLPIFKCAPPIRSAFNRQGLRKALLDGFIDTIGSDHSPCPADMKFLDVGNIQKAWGGIAGVQFMLPAVWQSMHHSGIDFGQLFQWMSTKPASLLNLGDRKGSIQAGKDADLVVWDPDLTWIVQDSDILHRNGISPYSRQELRGKVRKTYLRGVPIFEDGVFSNEPHGRTILR